MMLENPAESLNMALQLRQFQESKNETLLRFNFYLMSAFTAAE